MEKPKLNYRIWKKFFDLIARMDKNNATLPEKNREGEHGSSKKCDK